MGGNESEVLRVRSVLTWHGVISPGSDSLMTEQREVEGRLPDTTCCCCLAGRKERKLLRNVSLFLSLCQLPLLSCPPFFLFPALRKQRGNDSAKWVHLPRCHIGLTHLSVVQAALKLSSQVGVSIPLCLVVAF